MTVTAIADNIRPSRVLVFTVDDGCLCLDLEWVEAVYQRGDVPVHAIKDRNGGSRSFLIHRGEPALVVDLREALDLHELLGSPDRAALMVVRSGSLRLAVQVDALMGVKDLDLRTKTPVPTGLLRDGGLCVGHLVELDGRLHTLLEPSRILSSTLRERLELFSREAQAFRDRENKLSALVADLRHEPTTAEVKAYARLARRNGRTRVAAAARTILKALQENEQQVNGSAPLAGDLAGDTLVRDLVSLAGARQTGELLVEASGNEMGRVFFDAGRIADACMDGEWGRDAFKCILGSPTGLYRFVPSDTPIHPQRIEDATLWLLIETLEQLTGERRGRHAR